MYYVSRASDDYWCDFCEEESLEAVHNTYGTFIFESNDWYEEEPEEIIQYWDGHLTLDDAKKLVSCYYHILIYDTYVE